MTIVRQCDVVNPEQLATFFSAVLAADKGVPSELVRDGADWVVVADDGKAVRFHQV